MDTSLREKFLLQNELVDEHILVLYNDHDNAFDFVIKTLCTICGHTEEQAEQCTWIAHYKGKCEILTGSLKFINEKAKILAELGLTVQVQ
ncbi:MAG: hypothetical protein RL754_270 [Bacteroidota bacterium]|jgi:ATP-dependent Clp protease adaptor protein ClpS